MADTPSDMMKAASFDRFGGPEVLRIVARRRPRAKAGEVVVRVDATTVNGGEIAQRRGKLQWIVRTALPAHPGIDLAGEIVGTGPGVTGLHVGDRVWGTVDERGPVGTAAEYVAVPAVRLARMPEAWTPQDAVSLVAGGATALIGLRDKARLQPGERVLVRGAAGGVGSVAVQVSKALGAHVTALAHPRSFAFVRALGADEVIDYHRSPADLDRFDVIFDTRGTQLGRWRRKLTRSGRMVAIAFDLDRPRRSLLAIAASAVFGSRRIRFFLGRPTAELFDELRHLAESGSLRSVVDRVYPLERIRDAHADAEVGGVHGKIIVAPHRPADAPSHAAGV